MSKKRPKKKKKVKKTTRRKKPKKKVKRKRLTIAEKIKIKEISASLSGVIPIASFENLRPTFTMTVQPRRRVDPDEVITHLEDILHRRFSLIENRAKAELIERQYRFIRLRLAEEGKKYPSVTSILDYDNWERLRHIPEDELKQYAARGTIVDKLIQTYFETGKWKDPTRIEAIKEEAAIVRDGSLELNWKDCSHEKFISHYRRKIKIIRMKTIIFNNEHEYSGEIDAVGEFDAKRSIIDFKTGAFDMRQLAAYAVCESKIEQLVVFPVGPTDNVCGYIQPKICDTIKDKFKEFLEARGRFRERFGI